MTLAIDQRSTEPRDLDVPRRLSVVTREDVAEFALLSRGRLMPGGSGICVGRVRHQ